MEDFMKTLGWEQVYDAQGQRSRGLWKRGESFYVQCTTLDAQTGLKAVRRILLPNAKTEPQARKQAALVKDQAGKGMVGRKSGSPELSEYSQHYLEWAKGHKSEHTLDDEKRHLEMWVDYLGDPRLANITTTQILSFRTEQLRTVSPHTVNVRVNALKSLLKLAKLEGKIDKLPTEGVIQLPHTYKKKTLLLPEDIETIIATAEKECPKSGKQFRSYMFAGMCLWRQRTGTSSSPVGQHLVRQGTG